MTEEYYNSFGIERPKRTKNKNNNNTKIQIIEQLYKRPTKDKGINIPHFQVFNKDDVHQADLLFMPNDNGYKYILVVVDIFSRLCDAYPLKSKDANQVLKGFKEIFKRKILNIPKRLEVDSGSEFKSVVAKYFKDHNVKIRVAMVGRHRQQAIVESKNKTIGKALFHRMSSQELLTGEVSREWVEDLPKLIEILNNKTKKMKSKITKKDINGSPVCKGNTCQLIPIGASVRVILDIPKDVTGSRLHGKFRATDQRWENVNRKIEHIYLKPNMPPLYLVSGKPNVKYTKNQLQIINNNEEYPLPSVIRGKPKTYVIEKILNKKKIKNKYYYEIKWRGYSKTTLEPIKTIREDQPELVKEFESNN
jgi:hypothetical protein